MMPGDYGWGRNITRCAKILTTSPVNIESLSTAIISGAPNADNQFEITFTRTISAVGSPFFFDPVKLWQEIAKSVLNVYKAAYHP